jgi:hypothetical protein
VVPGLDQEIVRVQVEEEEYFDDALLNISFQMTGCGDVEV